MLTKIIICNGLVDIMRLKIKISKSLLLVFRETLYSLLRQYKDVDLNIIAYLMYMEET